MNTTSPECYKAGSFSLEVIPWVTANPPVDYEVCDTDTDGIQTFDLLTKTAEAIGSQNPASVTVSYHSSKQDADTGMNAVSTDYTNTITNSETLNVQVENTFNPDSPELNIDGGDFESWSWQNAAGTEIWNGQYFSVSELGTYTLTVSQTQNGMSCEKTVSFEVVSSGAPDSFTYDLNGFSDQIELVIEATGVGDFEYSIDGETYQDSNEFKVFPGTYTVFVRDKFECRTINQDIVAIGYLRFFTPNGDGTNEYWNIIGGDLYADAALFIYDRYGKLLKQLALNSPGWDGTYQGKPLPSSDYWFRYEYDNGKSVSGHFALKR